MALEFYPVFKASDFVELENFHIYLRLMINGKPSRPFSAITITNDRLLDNRDLNISKLS